MRIPARFSPLVFGALLSIVMVAIVSAFVLATTQGLPLFHRNGSGAVRRPGPLRSRP